MQTATRFLAVTLALAATVAIASDATDPVAKARQDVMDVIARTTRVLGDMATDKAPFDAAAAAAAKAELAAAAAEVPAKFEPQVSDPGSDARPEIWTNFADFTAKSATLTQAAGALDTSSLETLKAGFGAVGGTCRDCHQTYRN